MRILTYNIQRLQRHAKLGAMRQLILSQNADVLIFTESDTRIELPNYTAKHSTFVPSAIWHKSATEQLPFYYKATERRVSILSKYPIFDSIDTFDNTIALACKIATPLGDVVVYGTVLGISGKADKNFNAHLALMQEDCKILAKENNVIIAGDLNTTFADTYYTSKAVRVNLQDFFIKHKLINLTAGLPNCIDHIIFSQGLVVTDNARICKKISVENFGVDKLFSDHFGVVVEVE